VLPKGSGRREKLGWERSGRVYTTPVEDLFLLHSPRTADVEGGAILQAAGQFGVLSPTIELARQLLGAD